MYYIIFEVNEFFQGFYFRCRFFILDADFFGRSIESYKSFHTKKK